jgi:ParB family transcriptional regulator, chromosome partitioning protein
MSGKAFKDTTTADLFKFDPDVIKIAREGVLADGRTSLPVLESLVLDIMVRGVIEPIVVGKDEDGNPIVIDGRQRLKAAQEANRRLAEQGSKILVKIPAVYRQAEELGQYAAMISANEHRQEDDAIGRAKKAQRYLDLGATEEDAAIAFGVTTGTIRNWQKLLTLGAAAKSAIKDGRITPTAAIQLANLPREKQNETLTALISVPQTTARGTPKKPSVRQAKAAATGSTEPAKSKRMRGRAEIELVMAHHPAEVGAMTGTTALRWVLGHIEIEELKLPA